MRVQVKCDQYWPTRGSESYGFVHVTFVDVVELATYTIRTFQLVMVRHVAVCYPRRRAFTGVRLLFRMHDILKTDAAGITQLDIKCSTMIL